jgi:hypothetical protein
MLSALAEDAFTVFTPSEYTFSSVTFILEQDDKKIITATRFNLFLKKNIITP